MRRRVDGKSAAHQKLHPFQYQQLDGPKTQAIGFHVPFAKSAKIALRHMLRIGCAARSEHEVRWWKVPNGLHSGCRSNESLSKGRKIRDKVIEMLPPCSDLQF